MVLCLQQILQKEEITKSLDVAAVKAPAIQKETAHDDTDSNTNSAYQETDSSDCNVVTEIDLIGNHISPRIGMI